MSNKFSHLHVHSHYSLLDGLPKIDELFTRHTTQEVSQILDAMLSGDNSAESRSRQTTQYNQGSTVDQAFNELMSG